MNLHRPTVLIIASGTSGGTGASDRGFSREIAAHWPHDPPPHCEIPEFIALGEDFSGNLRSVAYDLAIADASSGMPGAGKTQRKPLTKRVDRSLKQALLASGKPAILIHSDPSLDFYNIQGSLLELRCVKGVWPAITGLVGREILRRCQAESRAREAEQLTAVTQAQATLGRYMIEMRSNVTNALTGMLGNAELMALESGLPASVAAQADTIRNMALRLHEVFQRFSSLENELNAAARESGKAAAMTPAALTAAAGR